MPDPNSMDPETGTPDNDGGQADWINQFDTLSSDENAVKVLSKYTSEEAALAGAVEAQKKYGKPYILPETLDKLSEGQQQNFQKELAKLRGVPDSAAGYEVERPAMPEGMSYDEELEVKITTAAHQKGVSKVALNAIAKVFAEHQIAKNTLIAEASQKAEDEYKGELGNKFKPTMANIEATCIRMSEELDLNYRDAKGELKSSLFDCLEKTRLGDRIPILKMIAHIGQNLYAEGKPLSGTPVKGGSAGTFSKAFYSKTGAKTGA